MAANQTGTSYVSPVPSFLANTDFITPIEAYGSENKPLVQTPNAALRRVKLPGNISEVNLGPGKTTVLTVDVTKLGFITEIHFSWIIQVPVGTVVSAPFFALACIKTMGIELCGTPVMPNNTDFKSWVNSLLWGMDKEDILKVFYLSHEYQQSPTGTNAHKVELILPWFGSRIWQGRRHALFPTAALGTQKLLFNIEFESNASAPVTTGPGSWSCVGSPELHITVANFLLPIPATYGTTIRIPQKTFGTQTMAGGASFNGKIEVVGKACVAFTWAALGNKNRLSQYYFRNTVPASMVIEPNGESDTTLTSAAECLAFMVASNPMWNMLDMEGLAATGTFQLSVLQDTQLWIQPWVPEYNGDNSTQDLTTVNVVPTYFPTNAFRYGVGPDDPAGRAVCGIFFFTGSNNITVTYSFPTNSSMLTGNAAAGQTVFQNSSAETYTVNVIATTLNWLSLDRGLCTVKVN